MQRLFSTFANGWPGGGLLVLRLALAAFMVHRGYTQMSAGASHVQIATGILVWIAALFLVIGLWTPVTAFLITFLHACYLIPQAGFSWDGFLGGALALGLALLGPGAHSADARIFGRKRISIDNAVGKARDSIE